MPVAVVVLFAASLHASWNALVKSVTDRVALIGVLNLSAMVISVPVALLVRAPRAAAWPEIGASLVLHTVYNLLLIETYRDGDYNQVYPIARGTAPPAVAIASVLVVSETLSPVQVGGLLGVSAGLLWGTAGRRHGSGRAVAFAVLTGLVIAAYTVVDGVGVRRSGSVLGYGSWLFIGSGALTPAVLLGASLRTKRPLRLPSALIARGVVAGILSVAAYTLVLWAQTHAALAVVAALRETSVVFAAILGAVVFRERLPSRRIFASVLIAAGAATLALG